METAIRVRGLTKRFGSRSALEGVTFDVSAGRGVRLPRRTL